MYKIIKISVPVCSGMLDYKIYLFYNLVKIQGVRCSSVVRAFAHDAMDRQIDPS